jgi:cell division protein FtsW
MAIGLAGMIVLMRVDYRRLQHPWVARGALAAVAALLLAALAGAPMNGTHRWVRFAGLSIQPSELAKPALVVFLADLIARRHADLKELRGPLLGCLVASAVVVALVAVQPDLGTALSIALLAFAVLFAAGLRWRYILVPGLVVGAAVMVSILLTDYQGDRVRTFLSPGSDPAGAGYQVRQSRLAVASGGLAGRGLGEGAQKLFFLPYPHTDFIFAHIGEELGLLGTLTVVAAFLLLMGRGLLVAARAPNLFLSLAALGITVMLVGQAFVNMGVCLGLLPAKGLPLPFISYGGSSLASSLLGAGILLNASQYGS